MTEQAELVIIGAGPAGLQAAATAGELGVATVVVDAYQRAGGQYFKQTPAAFQSHDRSSHQAELGTLLQRIDSAGVRVLSNTLVWGAFAAEEGEGWLLTLHGPEAPVRLQARALILATGAYDRPIPFPGWTLPGVMTAGAAQTLIKSQRILPGRRVLLSGAGPLQLAVAAALVHAGAEVVGVLEGANPGWGARRHARAVWGQWARLSEGWDYWRTLRSAGVPYRMGWSIVEARGAGEVTEAVFGRLDASWRPIPGTLQTATVDSVVIGYGFTPSTELSRLLGCAHDYLPEQGGYVPRRDAHMQTTLPGVYAAGDGAGIGGAELSKVEGQIAGLAAARQLGRVAEAAFEKRLAALRPKLAAERRFAQMLGQMFTPGPGLYTLPTDDTIICRCEEVTLRQVRAAVADGVRSVNELKGLTRVGMGNCQGRICGELAARLVAREAGRDDGDPANVAAAGIFTARPPIHPLPLSVLAGADTPER